MASSRSVPTSSRRRSSKPHDPRPQSQLGALFWGARQAIKRAWTHPMSDYGWLLGAILLLTSIGLVMVLSASTVVSYRQYDSTYSIFLRQLIFAVVGLGGMMALSRVPVRYFRRAAWVMYFASVVGLLLVFVPGIGVAVNGQRNWIAIGPIGGQPSEFAKFALVVWVANLLATRWRTVDSWTRLLWPLAPAVGVVLVLVLLEGDLGTALVIMPIIAGMLLMFGAPARLFGWMGAGAVTLIAAMSITTPYRLARLATWLDRGSDPTGTGWQVTHGMYGLASGGWWGVGLGGSREKWGYLPEAQTDFIIAVIGEELGLMGTLSILGLFTIVAIMLARIAMNTNKPFVMLATSGVAVWVVAQAIINVGAVVGVFPITGLPLPLISYGGSSLLIILLAMGMVLAFARQEPVAAEYIANRQAERADVKRRRIRRRPTEAAVPSSVDVTDSPRGSQRSGSRRSSRSRRSRRESDRQKATVSTSTSSRSWRRRGKSDQVDLTEGDQ